MRSIVDCITHFLRNVKYKGVAVDKYNFILILTYLNILSAFILVGPYKRRRRYYDITNTYTLQQKILNEKWYKKYYKHTLFILQIN